MESFRRVTLAVDGFVVTLTITPALDPVARIEPNPAPHVPSMVMHLVMVTAPNPPGSSASISPHSAVFEIAPAKVLQGAVRLQGLASSPTPDTHVRHACACAIELQAKQITDTAIKFKNSLILVIILSFESRQFNRKRVALKQRATEPSTLLW
jgi:hypothetical protein